MNNNKIKGGLYGLLIGDALGVPYEFYDKSEIPQYEQIEMKPPKGFRRSHNVKAGTWSDDGAQALCLLKSLQTKGTFNIKNFTDLMLNWYKCGYMAVDNKVFDIGIQTANALNAYKSGLSPEKSGMIVPDGKGNGALMRVLPLVLWHTGSDETLVNYAHRQCLPTHGNITNQVCCALYCLTARGLLNGNNFHTAFSDAVKKLRKMYAKEREYLVELEDLNPNGVKYWQGLGTGYVVDCLKSAFMIIQKAKSYEQAVKMAIQLGNDTDTTACVTGGLAGIIFGYDGIPTRWIEQLRGKEIIESLEK